MAYRVTASAPQPAPSIGVKQLLSSPATWAIIIVNIVRASACPALPATSC